MGYLMRSIRSCFGSGIIAALIVDFLLLNEKAIWYPEILKKSGMRHCVFT
ncbi:MAG: hypothetical protein K1W28_13045 [Lachnospiraceae bacterium]